MLCNCIRYSFIQPSGQENIYGYQLCTVKAQGAAANKSGKTNQTNHQLILLEQRGCVIYSTGSKLYTITPQSFVNELYTNGLYTQLCLCAI